MLGKTESFTSNILGDAADLEHNLLVLHNGHPGLGCALTGTHTNTKSLLGNGLIREDLDPDLTATLGVTGHGHTSGLDLVAGDPAGLQSLDPVVAVGDLVTAGGGAGHAATLHLAVFDSFGHQH